MRTSSDAPSSADQGFLEYHHYSGGLRADAFSLSGQRPNWAPPHDWVGFRDEFALTAEDRVIEVVKFASDNGPITWLGLYHAAPDKVYGDRKNHAGFGVWLLNGYPKEASLIVDALQRLLDVARDDDQERLSTSAQNFLGKYLETYVDEYESLPRPFGGLALAKNQVASTLSRRINVEDDGFEERLDDLIVRLFFYLPESDADKSRALILLTGRQTQSSIAEPENALGKLAPDLLKQIPIAMRAQSQSIAGLQQQLAHDREALDELDRTRDRLESELLETRRRANDAETQLRDLQASLQEDDERRRFSLLQAGIADVNNSVADLKAKLGSLRQDIVCDLRRDIRPAPSSPPTNEFRERHVTQTPVQRSASTPGSYDSNLWIIVAVVFSVLIIGALGWFAFSRWA